MYMALQILKEKLSRLPWPRVANQESPIVGLTHGVPPPPPPPKEFWAMARVHRRQTWVPTPLVIPYSHKNQGCRTGL